MQQNPFALSFGRVSTQIVERDTELQEIYADFDMEPARSTVYILTGPRGCGKTIALSRIVDIFKKKEDFVVARLSISANILEQLASLLYEAGNAKFRFLKTEFSFSFSGISFSVKGDNPVSSVHVYLTKLLKYYKKKGIRVLVAIDDVIKCPEMIEFIRAYQGFLIDHHDVRLLLTGLYRNISKLESERSLTFLLRAPKIVLSPLSLYSIASSYQSIFKVSEDESLALAKLTKGYAFGHQALGDILYRSNKAKIDKEVLREFDNKLAEWSYETIWSELSNREKQILTLIAEKKGSNQSLMKELNISKGNLAIYKKQLTNEGLIDVKQRGVSSFLLPRFDNFILFQKKLLEM